MSTINGTNGDDTIIGTTSSDTISSGNGNDTVDGGAGSDVIDGGNGSDTLDGGAGSDILSGGNGTDTFIYYVKENQDATDIYDGGNGSDALQIIFTGTIKESLAAQWFSKYYPDSVVDVNTYLTALQNYFNQAPTGSTLNFSDFGINLTVTKIEKMTLDVKTNVGPVAQDSTQTTTEDSSAVIGKFTASDADGDALSYTIISAPSKGSVVANADGTFIYNPGDAFDYLKAGETATVSFKYQVSDGVASSEATVTLQIKGVNDAAIAQNSNVTATEDAPYQFQLADFKFSDVDNNSISSILINALPVNGKLLLDGVEINSGLVISAADIEAGKLTYLSAANANGDNYANLSFKVYDGAVWSENTAVLNIKVTAVNDAPTDILLSNSAVIENSAATVGELSAVDVDSIAFTYSIVAGADNFEIIGNELKLKVPGLNYEAAASQSVTIAVTDEVGATINKTFTIAVHDANDKPTDLIIDGNLVNENSAAGTVIGKLTITDEDSSSVAAGKYTYKVYEGDQVSSHFDVDAQGNIVVLSNAELNFEAQGSYAIRVEAIDELNEFSISKQIDIVIKDVNEAPNDIILSNHVVAENVAGAVVGDLSLIDPDAADSINFSVDDARFEVINGQLKLKDNVSLDFENHADVTVNVVGTDAGGLSVSKSFVINVADVNEAPVVELQNVVSVVSENFTAGMKVADIVIHDDALGDNNLSLTGADADLFEIVGTELHLKADVAIDFETNKQLDVSVMVNDNEHPTALANVSIAVANVNEAPVLANALLEQVAREDSDFNFAIPSDAFKDVDEGDVLSYSATLADGSALPAWLHFDADNHIFSGMPTNSDVGILNVKVTATDAIGAQVAAEFQLTVQNSNDAPLLEQAIADQSVNANSAINFAISEDSFKDIDLNDALTYSATLADGSPLPSWLQFNEITREFSGMPTNDDTGVISIKVTATDTSGAVAADIFDVVVNSVEPVNTAPIANADNYSGVASNLITGNVLANDTDAQGDIVSIELISGPEVGDLVLDPAGDFTYSASAAGTYSFTYKAIDAAGNESAPATVTLTVAPPLPPPPGGGGINIKVEPVTSADSYSITLNQLNQVLQVDAEHGLIANDQHVMNVQLEEGPAHGELVLNSDGSFTYTPDYINADSNIVSFTYRAIGGSFNNLISEPQTVYITVNSDLMPIKNFTVAEGETVSLNDLHNIPTDGTITITSVVGAAKGLLLAGSTPIEVGQVISAADIANAVFTAQGEANGLVGFTYTSSNNPDNQSSVVIKIAPVNDTATVQEESYTVYQGNTLIKSGAEGVLANETYAADDVALQASLVTGPTKGSVAFNADGSFIYTPTYTTNNGTDTFTYKVNDGVEDIGTKTVTINILAASATQYSVNEDSVLSSDLINDNSGAVTAQLITGTGHGQLIFNQDGTFTYTPNADFNGVDSFVYKVNDGTDTAVPIKVEITVNSINDAPIANNDAFDNSQATIINEGTSSNPINKTVYDLNKLLLNDFDKDSNLQIEIVQGPQHGTISDGKYYFATSAPPLSGPAVTYNDSFTYRIFDGEKYSDVATAEVYYNSGTFLVNSDTSKYAKGNSFTLNEDGSLVNANIINNDSIPTGASLVIKSNVQHGQLTVNADKTINYTPTANFNGTDSFIYQYVDANGNAVTNPASVFLTVTPVTDPLVVTNDSYTAVLNETLYVNSVDGLLKNDSANVDGSAIRIVPDQSSIINPNADGSFEFTARSPGTYTFDYQLQSGSTLSNKATVTITVYDKMVANNDVYTIDEDSTLSTSTSDGVLRNDTQMDTANHTKLAEVISGPAHGDLVFHANGTFTYTPDANYYGVDSFTYKVFNGFTYSDPAFVKLNVTKIEDQPVATNDSISLSEDKGVLITIADLLGNDFDVENDDFILKPTDIVDPVHGKLIKQIGADGGISGLWYMPDENYSGTDSFTYKITQANGVASNVATVNLTIANDDNDAPVVTVNNLVAYQHYSATLSSANLNVADSDSQPSEIIYTVIDNDDNWSINGQTNGTITFTQADINNQNVKIFYNGELQHDANGNVIDPIINLSIYDGKTTVNTTLNLHVIETNDLFPDNDIGSEVNFNNIGVKVYDPASYYVATSGNDTVTLPDLTYGVQLQFYDNGGHIFDAGAGDDYIVGGNNVSDAVELGSGGSDTYDGKGNSALGTGDGVYYNNAVGKIAFVSTIEYGANSLATSKFKVYEYKAGVDVIIGGTDGVIGNPDDEIINTDTLYNIEYISGSKYNDIFIYDISSNSNSAINISIPHYQYVSGGGADTVKISVKGNPESSIILNDLDLVAKANTTLEASNAKNISITESSLIGGDGDDELKLSVTGSAGGSVVVENNVLASGNSGNDVLELLVIANGATVSVKNNNFVGSNSNDTFKINVVGNNNNFYGNAGVDTLDTNSMTSGVTINFATGTITKGTESSAMQNIENAIGTRFADTIIGGPGINMVSYAYSAVGFSINLATGDAISKNADSADKDKLVNIEDIVATKFDDSVYSSSLNNKLDASLGIDTINYSAATNGVTVNLSTGTATGHGTDILIGFENVVGSNFADTLIGDDGDNTIDGGVGDDQLFGGEGDDILISNSGIDVLNGGDGIDTADYSAETGYVAIDLRTNQAEINGVVADQIFEIENIVAGQNNDWVHGDDDANVIHGGAGDDELFGYVGDDTLYGDSGDDVLVGGLGADTLDGGEGFDTVTYVADDAVDDSGLVVDLVEGKATFKDTVSHTIVNVEKIVGSVYDDVLKGSNNADTLVGEAGDDVLIGRQGSDILDGGSGFDTVDYHNDTAITSNGLEVNLELGEAKFNNETDTLINIEKINGSKYDDKIYGSSRNEILVGNEGDDLIQGGAGHDTLIGGTGNDEILGEVGNDRLFGLEGDDVLIGGAGLDAIDGGTGIDTIDYSQDDSISKNGLDIDLTLGEARLDGVVLDYQIVNVENIIGSDYNDFINGNSGDNLLKGSAGDDYILGNGGNDTIEGGEGNDKLYGDDGDDEIDGNEGDDKLYGGNGVNELNGGDGIDEVDYTQFTSSDHIGIIVRETADNNIKIDVNNDDVSIFTDTLWDIENIIGTNYDDTFNYVIGVNKLDGAGGIDTIDFSKNESIVDGGINFDLINQQLTNEFGSSAIIGFENIIGTRGNDIIIGNSVDNEINGGEGDDVLDGGAGENIVNGGAGNDVLKSGDGRNTLNGDINIDTVDYSGSERLAQSAVGVVVDLSYSGETGQTTLDGVVIDDLTSIENIIGSVKADILTGSSENNEISGNGGDDYIYGDDGDDILNGDAGADHLYGDADNDELHGNSGNDTLYGGVGEDNLNGDEDDDVLYGEENKDNLFGGAGADTLIGGTGNDNLDGGEGFDTVDYSQESLDEETLTVDLQEGTAQLVGRLDTYTDTLINIEKVIATDYNDVLKGSDNADTLIGGAGDDLLIGRGGDDYLDGGAGFDTLDYSQDSSITDTGNGNGLMINLGVGTASFNGEIDTISNFEKIIGSNLDDIIISANQASNLQGEQGDDLLTGLAGDDTLDGGDGNDTLNGNNGNDTLIGGEGDDILDGGNGNNTVNGGSGNDTFKNTNGSNVLIGGSGIDTVDYSSNLQSLSGGMVINLAAGTTSQIGNESVVIDTLSEIENVIGTIRDDLITGDSQDNILDGDEGDDILIGGEGADVLNGGFDNDILIGGEGDDILDGNLGSDTVDYSQDESITTDGLTVNLELGTGIYKQSDVIISTDSISNIENITGTVYADTLIGNEKSNIINGGEGNDIIAGGSGADTLDGGDGFDILNYSLNSSITSGVLVDLGLGTVNNGSVISNFEKVIGSNFNDVLNGGSFDSILEGGAGNDILNGQEGNDVLQGGDGNDTFRGGSGINELDGGDGDDTFILNGGFNTVNGGQGVDTVNYSVNGLTVTGITVDLAAGTTTLVGSTNIIDTLTDIENVSGTLGSDHIIGNSSDNILKGAFNNDYIDGGLGADALYGEQGNDALVYDAADSIIAGGSSSIDTDTLIVTSLMQDNVLDLTALVAANKVQEIEQLNIDGQYTVNLDAATVVNLSDNNTLKINNTGNQAVTVKAAANETWTDQGVNADGYHVYTNNTATLLIENDPNINFM